MGKVSRSMKRASRAVHSFNISSGVGVSAGGGDSYCVCGAIPLSTHHPSASTVSHSDLRPAAVRRPHSASTPSYLVATIIVHNLALIAHCQRISQSNRPPHHAHSTINPISPSPVNKDLLDEGLTFSLLLSPTMIRSNLSPSPKSPATSSDLVPFLCAVVSPSFHHPPSSYLPKTTRPTAKRLASSSQRRFVGKKRE